jgi:hypothetical protein
LGINSRGFCDAFTGKDESRRIFLASDNVPMSRQQIMEVASLHLSPQARIDSHHDNESSENDSEIANMLSTGDGRQQYISSRPMVSFF